MVDLLQSWVARGVVTPEQAAVMRADLEGSGAASGAPPPPAPVRPAPAGSVLIEALGWLGAAIVVIGLGVLVSGWWEALGAWGRIVLIAAVAALLVGAGFTLPAAAGSARRVRVALWLAGALGAAFAAGLLTDQVLAPESDERTGLVAALACAAVSAVLWRAGRHGVQHLATALSLGLAAALLTAWAGPEGLDSLWPGLAAAAVGAAWALLSLLGVVRPPDVGLRIGAALSLVGVLTTLGSDAGRVVAVLVVAAWVGGALLRSDLALLAMASFAALVTVPVLVGEWFPGALSAALALLLVGGLLVGAAVVVARRRREAPAV